MEAPLNFVTRMVPMKKYVVLYGLVQDTDEDGVFFDYTYFGGETNSPDQADNLARDITNDSSLPGTVVVKILNYESINDLRHDSFQFENVVNMANRQFSNMARSLYESEEMQSRGRRSRKRMSVSAS